MFPVRMEEPEDQVAVVGIGCNFPGGEGLDSFWKVLVEGRNCSGPIPRERFDLSHWYDPDGSKAGKSCTARAALIDRFNEFDHKFFGLSDPEVEQMDPQQKQILQCVYRALENAGLPLERVSGTRTGVFFGLMNRDYETNAAHVHPSVINHWTGTGLAASIAANRVSYVFNLTGPSLSVDCACSSSLVALHLACQSIKQGDCDMALCGGVSCILEPRVFVALSKAQMISPEGTSKPFSSTADGYGRGEGCGVVLLKPLRQAIKDHDHIWGLISKSAVNQDGRSVTPITKPSMSQQEELLNRIYSEADRAEVQYVEAHGTGTTVGDLTEAASISKVISKCRPAGSETLRVGSVKGNIGHTESAAGVAGLIKVLLMMKHQTFVPTVYYSQETSGVDEEALNIKIVEEPERWETSGGRTAGVNSFGFGGTNAHAIIKQHDDANIELKKEKSPLKYFVLSAHSQKSLTLMVKDVIKQIDSNTDLDALSYTSACRRSHRRHRYRKAVRVSSVDELKEKLRLTVGDTVSPGLSDPRLVFVFCGNGVSYARMCRQLLELEPMFREKVREVSQHFRRLRQLHVLDRLETGCEESSDPEVVQPLLFAIQVAISSLLCHWGVRPDAVLGHSVGEVAAAHCSGLLSLEDAVKVIHVRSALQSRVTGGRMLVISHMAVSKVTDLIHKHSGRICIAAYNSPESCTISGDVDSIQSLYRELRTSAEGQDLFLQVLGVPAAYHSSMMDPVLTEVEETIGTLQVNSLDAELFSTVTGEEAQQGDFCTGRYWAKNIREPVAFEAALRSAAKGQKNIIFVEIGPRRALQRNIQETLGWDTPVLPSVQPEKDHQTLTSVVSELFELGVHVNWDMFYRGAETRPLPIPKYQFDCSVRDVIIGAAQRNTSPHPVLFQTGSEPNVFTCDLMSESNFYLREHKHNNVPIIPGAFYAELGLAAFMVSARPKVALRSLLLSITFHSPFLLTQNSPDMKVHLQRTELETRFTVLSSSTTYASGCVSSQSGRMVEEPFISLDSIFKRCRSVLSAQDFYRLLSKGGFQYGEVLQNKGDVHYGEDLNEAYAVVTVPKEIRSQLQDFYIHPVVLDFLMQLLPVTVQHSFSGRPGFPARIGSLTVCEPLREQMLVYLRATVVGADHFEVCGCFSDEGGRVLVEVKHVVIRYLKSGSHEVEEFFYHNVFSPVPVDLSSAPPPRALVFSDPLGISEGLRQYLDSQSWYIPYSQAKDFLSHEFAFLMADPGRIFDEVLFLWGKEDLTSLRPDVVLQSLADCCEIFRQIVLKLKQIHFPNSIRTITFCSSDVTVDHVNPGFALAGMVRSCAAEIPELLFQLIDIHSVSPEDIQVLSQVLRSCPSSWYPELVVKDGMVLKPSIVRSPPDPPDSSLGHFSSTESEPFVLQTADAHQMLQLSPAHSEETVKPISDTSVEIRPTKICVHTSDFFPISESHLRFGSTLYWNKHSSQKHRLLALDFSGTITAAGKSVKKLRVGDQVAVCYPVMASSRVRVPEAVCYDTRRFPFLQNPPCVSYFVLAWEILNRALPRAKQNLGILSSVLDSALLKVLSLTSFKSGWNVVVDSHCNGMFTGMNRIDAFIILPPFDESLSLKICSFPSVQHVIFICDSQMQGLLNQNVFHAVKEKVHVQMIQMSAVLQRGSLTAQRPHIYRWIKSLKLSRTFSLESFIFQRERSEHVKSLDTGEPQSYFTSKKLSVVVLEDDISCPRSDIPSLPTQKPLFRKGALYVVSGGLSGLGFETVKFISQRGGGLVLILSRSRPSPDIQWEIDSMERQCGTRILSMECDVSVSEDVNKVFSIITEKFPYCPIRGVFHSAVVLHDGLMESLDRSLFEKVFKPKVNGALNLHLATQGCPLDYFVCFSSISAFLGNAAQTNYAAANTFLDLFCQYRRRLGLPAQSISWGALNLGLLLNLDHFQRFLEAKGMMVLDVVEFHKSLEKCLLLNRPQQAVCRFHFKNIRFNILSQNKALTLRLSALVEEAFTKPQETDSGSEPDEKVSSEEFIVSLLCETSGVDQSELTDERLLSTLGIDSMQAMTLQNVIFQERGVNVPLVKLLDPTASLSTLREILSQENLCDNMNSPQIQDTRL